MTVRDEIFRNFPFEPTQGQHDLAGELEKFINDPEPWSVFVLKGYAGTGKTSFVSAMVRILPVIRKKAVLLAPTGRAAKVLSGYAGQPAWTIHKRIYFQRIGRDGSMTLVMQKNLYRNTLFFVDEASMIAGNQVERDKLFSSRNLLDDLVEYVYSGDSCRLLMIGDTAQLPPVGMAISPALDLDYLKTRFNLKIFRHELTEVMRQSLESGILSNATALRQKLAAGETGLPLFDIHGRRDILSVPGHELEELFHNAFSPDQISGSVVICRSNKRANLFNKEIRNRILFRENEISAGDHLMVVKNNYYWLDPDSGPGFIANGDIIELQNIRNIEDLYGFRFADATVRMTDYPAEPAIDVKILMDVLMAETPSLPDNRQKELYGKILEEVNDIPQKSVRLEKVRSNPYYNAIQVKFAYALTCHKTQGGQWENVFVDQGYLKAEQVDAEYLRWLYTALTRATKKVYLLGFIKNFFV